MAGALRVPSQYATPAAAIADAAPGDVVLLAPGSYGRFDVPKPVHVVADTTDVYGAPVEIIGEDNSDAVRVTATGGQVVLEGLLLRSQAGPIYDFAFRAGAGADVLLNRCAIEIAPSGTWSGHHYPVGLLGANIRVRLQNCSRRDTAAWYWDVVNVTDPASRIGFYATEWLKEAPGSSPLAPGEIAEWVDDTVRETTPGYGVEYGEWLLPQLLEGAYRVAGTETLEPRDSPEDVQILLFRETAYQSGKMQRYAWLETTPDPVTGEWEFEYLPTTDSVGNPQRYAVGINRPECYPAELLRWYTPAQS